MDLLHNILPVIGFALCAMAVGQLALWSARSIKIFGGNRVRFQQQQSKFKSQLKQATEHTDPQLEDDRRWRGYRNFRVERLVRETENAMSVFLVPVDGKPISQFEPGQHLTLRLNIPAHKKPVVRSYSLSNAPGESHYRITVKEVPPPTDRPELCPGKASHYINRKLQVGQEIEVKAPAGSFFLNQNSDTTAVLLAGGVGITPMVSMIERLVKTNANRLVLLAYGTRNGSDHTFKKRLRTVSDQHPNVHLLTCYSNPDPQDQLGNDYQLQGYVSAELLQSVLPHQDCEFYLCGPPAFMTSVYEGLLTWGVEKSNIQFEAFGPASIGKLEKKITASVTDGTPHAGTPIQFAESGVTATWDGTHDSLLEFAEANEIDVDSGCRSGNCGSCEVELIKGAVEYTDDQKPDCPPGRCLMCIARPRGSLELGA